MYEESAVNHVCHMRRKAAQYYVRIRRGTQLKPEAHGAPNGGQLAAPVSSDGKCGRSSRTEGTSS